MLKLSDFDYDLPKELISQYPLKERDTSRLLVLNRKKQTIEHRIFKDITDYFNKGDLIVLNNTKVLSCRLRGTRLSGGKVEILLLRHKSNLVFDALIKPSRLRLGEKVTFDNGKLSAVVCSKGEIVFDVKDLDSVYNLGVMPLPPYIKRSPEMLDTASYQTVYASEPGAIASPTAGLHFTEELLLRLRLSGVLAAYITLHVGYGTFRPVKTDDIMQHKMEPEYFKVPEETINLLKEAQLKKNRVFSVGTTTLRTLETGKKEGWTDLFIYPGYKFKTVDCLLTNFHLPRTTLYILVCAFAGENLIKKAYNEAINRKYRFYSYGDAMLII
ncbi:MAG: tRNA preQ1(34) S-adenosylmethionine ribosyltransferase-isomerase QueA [Candidatus Omnitrophota bacterium]|nr:tRNA preQ1(34) S-adenosylmethionine ribosyltransferase-isomerase QueA [Candidatus Omnitrophota bacterium]